MRTAIALLFPALVLAGPTTDAHLEEALAAAGENRAEMEKVLAHFAKDDRKLAAARFLIANMPGHGYIVTELRDAEGKAIPYDPLAYKDFKAALAALDEIEKKHGEVDFARDRKIEDIRTLKADFLIQHIERSFQVWQRVPERFRVDFDTFLNYILPHRGSQEPIDDWLGVLMERYGELWTRDDAEPATVAKAVAKDERSRVKFNERYYLHPTDQGFLEMERSGQGRCEDMTNHRTFAMRAVAIATAADYTPWWAHRDNNHAWNVRLDKNGRGFAKANAHAAKVYRKTYAIQRDNLCFRLAEGREAPNRFLKSPFYIDVTDQYRETTEVGVHLAGDDAFAYLCVFNGGVWKAIHWARTRDGHATFDRMGRDIVYLPAFHDGEKLVPAADPLIVTREGKTRPLNGQKGSATLLATAVHPRKVSPDTGEVTPKSYLEPGTTYILKEWTPSGWAELGRQTATSEPLKFESLAENRLYWLVAEGSRELERVFTIEGGRQRFW